MIEVKNLTAFYEKSERTIFDNISFKLTNDSLSALCGKNGSGKSTLLLLMAGILCVYNSFYYFTCIAGVFCKTS